MATVRIESIEFSMGADGDLKVKIHTNLHAEAECKAFMEYFRVMFTEFLTAYSKEN